MHEAAQLKSTFNGSCRGDALGDGFWVRDIQPAQFHVGRFGARLASGAWLMSVQSPWPLRAQRQCRFAADPLRCRGDEAALAVSLPRMGAGLPPAAPSG